MAYTVFKKQDNNEPKRHYNVRILSLQPTKVLINGRIRDRASLTPEEHRAVQTQEEIEKAREELKNNSITQHKENL